jgi:nucleotide-binding universal stress UspA family protein
MTRTIVAYIGEGRKYWPLIERAIDVAEERQARLIFYDSDAASMFSNPLPTVWSADGQKEQFDDRLDPEQLEKAGREEVRDHVIHARDRGIDAWGWLPSKRDAKALGEYAQQHGATLVIIPKQLEKSGLGDWLRGRPTAEQIVEESEQPVLEVDLEPEAAKT